MGIARAGLLALALAVIAAAQATHTSAVERGIALAAQGHCRRALAALAGHLSSIADKQLGYRAALATAQCGMELDREAAVGEALLVLHRDFPKDPEVLYLTTHDYSELANRTAHRLLEQAPRSAQAEELLAEAMVARGQYDDASAAYRKILAEHPHAPGIHYQLGRILLARPLTAGSARAASAEFAAELEVNPGSAASEFMLGDIAWHEKDGAGAMRHFRRAITLDAGLDDAYLGLGIALNGAGHYREAIAPLEKYVAAAPDDPAGHYQLFLAYGRSGDKAKAGRQLALARSLQQAHRQAPTTTEDMLQPH